MHRWVECVEAVSGNVGAVSNSISAALDHFLVLLSQHSPNVTHATEVVVGINQRITCSSSGFIECLTDLTAMSKAMKDVMDANPEEADDLVYNIFIIFLKQLGVYFRDTSESLEQAGLLFHKLRSSESVSPPTSSPSALVAEATRVTLSATVKPPKKNTSTVGKTGEQKKKNIREADEMGATPLDADKSSSLSDRSQKGKKHEVEIKSPTEYASVSDNDAAAATTNDTVPQEENSASVSLAEASLEVQDPEYLQVTSTVEDALGRLVLSSRPNVFTPPELIEQRMPITTYYISLPTPGRLGLFLLKNYIDLEEDLQADLMCDILQTDCVDVNPFVSTMGEITVENSMCLREIPACGWRLGVSDNSRQKLYTQYILVNRGAEKHASLLIQDSILTEGERDEVLHVITPLPEALQFAKVTVYGLSSAATVRNPPPGRGYSTGHLSAIVIITKNVYEQNGFVEVKESDVLEVTQQQLQEEEEQRGLELLAKNRPSVTAFHGTVELASLDQPGEQPGWGFSDVAKGAVRGAAAAVFAPVSVGMVVGNAVLNASGVVGAIKHQTEGLFRKSFSHLESEEIIETFGCALVEGGVALPRQGFLFLTPHWLCFQASLVGANFSLEWNEIKDIQKQRSVKVLENSIAVVTHLDESFFLTSFIQRELAYNAMMKQWLRK